MATSASPGNARSNWVKASSPPAEAPTPTTVKSGPGPPAVRCGWGDGCGSTRDDGRVASPSPRPAGGALIAADLDRGFAAIRFRCPALVAFTFFAIAHPIGTKTHHS